MKKVRGRTKTITWGEGGWRAEVLEDDDNGSGYGDNPLIGFWFGTKEACELVDPYSVKLYTPHYSDIDSFDVMCERKWD